MIAVDTNILVYAHREDSPFHDAAAKRIADLAEGRRRTNCRASGPRGADCALCNEYGVRELWSNRDFNRFAGLMVVNPLVESGSG